MNIVFIVGFWNSGTTLLTDILRKHPKLKLRRARFKPNLEDRTIRKILHQLGTDFIEVGDYSEIIQHGFTNYTEPQFDAGKSQQFKSLFLKKYHVQTPRFLLLKNPWLLFMPNFLRQHFAEDEVKFIVILRDGRSQVVSKDYWLRNTTDPKQQEQQLYARAHFWVRCMEYYFSHWHQHTDTYTFRYENLCTHPTESVQKVCQFIDIPFIPLYKKMPQALQIKMRKWNQLDKDYQRNVWDIVEKMQKRIDLAYPIHPST